MHKIEIEISSQVDHAHYGEDLPWDYAANIVFGSQEDAIGLLTHNLGGSERLDAFNIEADGTTLHFKSFSHAEVGTVFGINTSIAAAKLAAAEEATITNELERFTDLAFIELFPAKPMYARFYWWERTHPDPDLPPLMDANGFPIEVGKRCLFQREQSEEWIAGWVKQISAHPERPVGVKQMDYVSNFCLGCTTTQIRMIADSESSAVVFNAVKEQVRRKIAERDFFCISHIGSDPEMRRLLAKQTLKATL